jgi:malate dehydrogenase (oxaloacetate-decarboxylating)(NADP+)
MYHALRRRKGLTKRRAISDLRDPFTFGAMMVKNGDADGLIGGVSSIYPDVLRPALQIIGTTPGVGVVAGMYMFQFKRQLFFLADCTVNVYPTAEQLAEIALLAAKEVELLGITPRVALLSFSNFGTVMNEASKRVETAVDLIHSARPELVADGPVHADVALSKDMLGSDFSFSRFDETPNILVMPNLDAGNIAYKLLKSFSSGNMIGPIMLGMERPVHVVDRDASIPALVNLAAITSIETHARHAGKAHSV